MSSCQKGAFLIDCLLKTQTVDKDFPSEDNQSSFPILWETLQACRCWTLTPGVRWRSRSVSRGWGWRGGERCWGPAGRQTASPPACPGSHTRRILSYTRKGTWRRNTCCLLFGDKSKKKKKDKHALNEAVTKELLFWNPHSQRKLQSYWLLRWYALAKNKKNILNIYTF